MIGKESKQCSIMVLRSFARSYHDQQYNGKALINNGIEYKF